METVEKNVGVLAVCQGLLLANNSALVTVNALAGYALATDKSLATLPVTAYFVGSMLITLPLSLLMKRYGRRAGFTLGAVFAVLGRAIHLPGMAGDERLGAAVPAADGPEYSLAGPAAAAFPAGRGLAPVT